MTSLLFMQSDTEPTFSWWTSPNTAGREVLLVTGVILVVTVLFFILAAAMRSPRRKHHHHHSSHEDYAGLPKRSRKGSGWARLFGAKHRRRRTHRRERPMNPTLAQAGGLPPRRDDEHPPS